VLERSLEIAQVGRKEMKTGSRLHIFHKKVPKNLFRLSFSEIKI